MYPSFTLHPNGAFMLCESIGDIPYHPTEGEVAVTPVEGSPRVTSIAQKIVEKPDTDDDPVVKTINKLSKVYENHVKPLLSMNYTYEDPDDAIGKLEQISSSASAVVTAVHKRLLKVSAAGGSYSERPSRIQRAKFDAHLGYLIKNAPRVHQEGIESYPYEYQTLPAICDTWNTREMMNSFLSNPELMEMLHYSATLSPLTHGGSFSRSFEGFTDFLHCVFNDYERLLRLESRCSYNLEFDHLLATARGGGGSIGDAPSFDSPDSMVRETVTLMALTLKKVCRTCYDLECAIVDGDITPEVYRKQVTPVLYSILNLFGIGVMITLALSYDNRAVCAQVKALEEYTDLLLTTLKAH